MYESGGGGLQTQEWGAVADNLPFQGIQLVVVNYYFKQGYPVSHCWSQVNCICMGTLKYTTNTIDDLKKILCFASYCINFVTFL